ncbi:MAG: hypothetical protein HC802_13030 [Caldilineaceae bacterium]|nr:hypothetical protein [Caldilineaceae bacterium]
MPHRVARFPPTAVDIRQSSKSYPQYPRILLTIVMAVGFALTVLADTLVERGSSQTLLLSLGIALAIFPALAPHLFRNCHAIVDCTTVASGWACYPIERSPANFEDAA